MSSPAKVRRIVSWVLTVLLSALFIASAAGKLSGAKQVVEMFEKWGLKDFVLLIGVGELVSALLFLIPRTHSLGLLLLSGYMGGCDRHPYAARGFLRHAVGDPGPDLGHRVASARRGLAEFPDQVGARGGILRSQKRVFCRWISSGSHRLVK